MGMMYKKQAAVPPGRHTGQIINAELGKRIFNPDKGPEDTFIVTILPDWKSPDGAEVLPVTVNWSPQLNGLSALSQFLRKINCEPEEGKEWDHTDIIGEKVQFTTERNPKGFVRVLKDTLKAA